MFNDYKIKQLNNKIESLNTVKNTPDTTDNKYLEKCKIIGYERDTNNDIFRYHFQSINPDNTINKGGIVGEDAICINEIGQSPDTPLCKVGDIVFIQASQNGYEFCLGGVTEEGLLDPIVDLTPKEKDKEWWISKDIHTLEGSLSISYSSDNMSVGQSLIKIKEFEREMGGIALSFSNVAQEQTSDNKYKTTATFTGTYTQTEEAHFQTESFQFSGSITILSIISTGYADFDISGSLSSPVVEGDGVSVSFTDGNKVVFIKEHINKAVKISTLLRVGFEDGELKFVLRDLYFDSIGNLIKVDLPNGDVDTALHIHSIPIITRPAPSNPTPTPTPEEEEPENPENPDPDNPTPSENENENENNENNGGE